ncbi:MAG: hypothetical protein KC586_21240, partial [Myxococcales bacterium]|nr:hypothetical protein [Myxococcales bacterium]
MRAALVATWVFVASCGGASTSSSGSASSGAASSGTASSETVRSAWLARADAVDDPFDALASACAGDAPTTTESSVGVRLGVRAGRGVDECACALSQRANDAPDDVRVALAELLIREGRARLASRTLRGVDRPDAWVLRAAVAMENRDVVEANVAAEGWTRVDEGSVEARRTLPMLRARVRVTLAALGRAVPDADPNVAPARLRADVEPCEAPAFFVLRGRGSLRRGPEIGPALEGIRRRLHEALIGEVDGIGFGEGCREGELAFRGYVRFEDVLDDLLVARARAVLAAEDLGPELGLSFQLTPEIELLGESREVLGR